MLLGPDSGDLIKQNGGLRKIRWAGSGHGKRGGIRVIYYFVDTKQQIYMLFAYARNESDDLTADQLKTVKKHGYGVFKMKQELFNELLESIRQAGEIRKGKQVASRMNNIEDPDVRQIRDSYDMSQHQFASLLGISVATLRNWEQGRRKPQGPAKVLLRVAAKRPKAILESL